MASTQLEIVIQLESLKEDIALDEEQAVILGEKYTANKNLLESLKKQANQQQINSTAGGSCSVPSASASPARNYQQVWLGESTFVHMPLETTIFTLESEDASLYEEITRLQLEISKKIKLLERFQSDYDRYFNKR